MVVFFLALALGGEADPLDAYLAQRLAVVERPVNTVYARDFDRRSGSHWFVQRDGVDLNSEDFALALGDDAAAKKVRRRRRGTVVLGIGSVAAGLGTGLLFLTMPPVGLSVAAVGVGTGTICFNRARTAAHPSRLYTRDEATARVVEANQALRDTLMGPE